MSAFSSTQAVADNSTLANFKSWVQLIHNALVAAGWTQTADTGQLNLTTVSTVPAISTSVYEIWTMADTIQATTPVFIRFDYGSGAAVTTATLAVTVGTGSSGAGVITNPGTKYSIGPVAAGGTATLYDCYFSGDTNRFQMAMWTGLRPAIFSVERSKTTLGADNSNYIVYLVAGAAVTTPYVYLQVLYPTGTIVTEQFGCFVNSNNTSSNIGMGSVVVCPSFPLVGMLDNPLIGSLCIKTGDFVNLVAFSATLYGAAHTFLPIKDPSTAFAFGNQTTNSIGMRYE